MSQSNMSRFFIINIVICFEHSIFIITAYRNNWHRLWNRRATGWLSETVYSLKFSHQDVTWAHSSYHVKGRGCIKYFQFYMYMVWNIYENSGKGRHSDNRCIYIYKKSFGEGRNSYNRSFCLKLQLSWLWFNYGRIELKQPRKFWLGFVQVYSLVNYIW